MWVTLSQHRSALGACTVQSWETWEAGSVGKAGLVGMGRGDPAAEHFYHVRRCPGVMGGGGCLGKPCCSSRLPGPRAGQGRVHSLCPIGHMLLALVSGQRGKNHKQLLASCRPAIFQDRRKSSARGDGHYVKWLGLFQSGTDTFSPPDPGEDTALAELLRQPYGAGQGVVCHLSRPPSVTGSGKTFVCQVRIGPRGVDLL